jgi:glutathionyl-hydroquinone reductase
VTAAPPQATPFDVDRYGTVYAAPAGTPRAPRLDLDAYPFRGRIGDGGEFPAEPGRYHLFISWACPFAHRSAIVRELKGLQDVVGLSVVDPLRDGRGWAFRAGPDLTLDTSGSGFSLLAQAYDATVGGHYEGRVTVPVLWDTRSGRIVSNHYPDISIDLGTQFDRWAAHPEVELYPQPLREQIDALAAHLADTVNTGVYQAGFATDADAYEQAVRRLFATFDELEALLARRDFLVGDRLTEADIRLWVTLVRFDSVYHGHFKANLRRLTEYPALWAYTRRLYALPGFGSTTHLDQIKAHYYGTQRHLNPSGIVPLGPLLDWEGAATLPPERF